MNGPEMCACVKAAIPYYVGTVFGMHTYLWEPKSSPEG